ncbi:carbohydrate porin [Methylocystis heyeri]|uniref:Porin n=1 Tax=Methylocystis heyeri TaxID=391905 RepID=A0A6B8KFI8_9HYPH|nr:carbohydrate porin [Methylocystis heyeri]QGM46352.1 porin [Methylocystis heyeri]
MDRLDSTKPFDRKDPPRTARLGKVFGLLAVVSVCTGATRVACAESVPSFESGQPSGEDQPPEKGEPSEKDNSSLSTRRSLADTPGGLKEQLQSIGMTPNVWVTQIEQGQIAGDRLRDSAYGGKMDAFLKVDADKLGLWRGFRVNVQYEHFFGRDINYTDYALLPVNAAQAFVSSETYHSALSVVFTQDIGERLSVSAGKINTMTLAAQTPLIGGGGVETFMNRAFAAPATGIGVTTAGRVRDRLIVSPTYTLGAAATFRADPIKLTLAIADPRNAQDPRVLERPFEKGVVVGGIATFSTEIAGLQSFHTIRSYYSNARGFDLEDIDGVRQRVSGGAPLTKKGYWFASYGAEQYLFRTEDNPNVGWGLFSLVTLSDGNPNPVKWTALGGLGGNNLLEGRELDRWGVGFFHYGLSAPLLAGLAALQIYRRSEGGVEAFYNYAITPWLRLSADMQVVEPWTATKTRATYAGLRLQTKF